MKKLLLFAMMCVLGLCTVNAQEPDTLQETNADSIYLICERFDTYEVGDKIAEKGNGRWSTWNGKAKEDGVVAADTTGNKYAHFKNGNDQILFLGDYVKGCFEIEFDVYVPNGKSAYFNFLHDFSGSSSTWATEGYLHMASSDNQTPNKGVISVADENIANFDCVYNAWTHLRFVIDIDRDTVEFFYTLPNAEETSIVKWQWSKSGLQDDILDRHLDAMNFFPPLKTSEFYVDNITVKKTNGETAPEISFEESIKAGAMVDDVTSIEVTFENTGNSIADYTAWIDYGVSNGGGKVQFINYDDDISETTGMLGLTVNEPTYFELGAMYTAAAYSSSVAGTKITHISYPFSETEDGNGNFGIVKDSSVVFRIYKQGFNGQPGECLAEKVLPYSEIKTGWVSAELDEPVVLSGFNVWATVTLLQSKGGYPLIFDGKTENTVPYGDVIRIGKEGPFYLAHEMFSQSYGNIHIRVTCAGDPVFGGWAELESVDGVVPFGQEGTMTINFNTFGLEGGKTYEAKVVFAVNNTDKVFEAPLSLRVWGEDVEEVLNNNYNIYPNPTTGMVTVEGENIDFITVYNSVGQLIKVVKTQNNVVDMSACENGVYFFNVVDNAGQNSVQRVVVAK